MLLKNTIVFATCAVLTSACLSTEPTEVDEIIDNLVEAGFPEDDIQVEGETVYVGNDAQVSLAASREMLDSDDGEVIELDTIQYRTRNLVSRNIKTICIVDGLGNATLKRALDQAIANYNNLGLTFRMRKGVVGCNARIQAWFTSGSGGVADLPSNGRPGGRINIGINLKNNQRLATWVIMHELGHTLGFRHSDFYNRSISCGQGGNEGDAGIGSIHIPGTPTGAVFNGSLMNSCYNNGSLARFTSSDIRALQLLY